MTAGSRSRRQRGVSLIEALVALAVMGFGMLAVAGVQATLRYNGDLARQRNEALRIAQEQIELWRAFGKVEAGGTEATFADITGDGTLESVSVTGTALEGRVNTSFERTLQVTDALTSRMKWGRVQVAWTDRRGDTQRVELSTAIAGAPLDFAASLALPPASESYPTSPGRHRSIPLFARTLDGTGTSVFVPPQTGGGTTVVWVFNNLTGLITGICELTGTLTTATVTAGDVSACSVNATAQLLSGYVRFASIAAQPDAAQAAVPSGTPLDLDMTLALASPADYPAPPVCFDDSAAATGPGATITYYCAIPAKTNLRWAGRSRVAPVGTWVIGTATGQYKVCRYTTLASDTGPNIDHPLDYTENGSPAGAALNNQNFLVVSSAHTCPTDSPTAGDFINSNTRLHQDGSVTYSNS